MMKNQKTDAKQVYDFLLAIPRGCVVTYGQIAAYCGNPKAARAVGRILHSNPDGDKYPCYKVVNAEGKLSPGYAFGGMEAQKRRLEADGILVVNERVDLKRYRYTPEEKNR